MTSLNIKSTAIKDGVLDRTYGGYGDKLTTSFDITWDKVENAKSYALLLIDYDAVHVVGYPFIHWTAANIKDNKLVLDATHLDKTFIQGQNSKSKVTWSVLKGVKPNPQELLENACYYGPFPPDSTHTYSLYIYALDIDNVGLENGFFYDELREKVKGHVIGFDILEFKYIK